MLNACFATQVVEMQASASGGNAVVDLTGTTTVTDAVFFDARYTCLCCGQEFVQRSASDVFVVLNKSYLLCGSCSELRCHEPKIVFES